MIHGELLNKFIEALGTASTIAVVPAKNAGVDAFCAGVGLYHLLMTKDKAVTFIYPGKVPEGCDNFIDKSYIVSNATERELIVAVNYSDAPNAKVQYSMDDGVLYLRIKPVKKTFDTNKITAHLSNHNYDVIVIIGASSLDELGHLSKELATELAAAKIINIDTKVKNTRYGTFNLVDTADTSLSLFVLNIVKNMDIKLSRPVAKALLFGIGFEEPKIPD